MLTYLCTTPCLMPVASLPVPLRLCRLPALFLLLFLLPMRPSYAQLTVLSDPAVWPYKSYSVTTTVKPKSITSTNGAACTSRYNYDVVYDYSVTFSGDVPSSVTTNGLYKLQTGFTTHDEAPFDDIALPDKGGSGTSTTDRKKLRTAACDYATATPASLGISVAYVKISGPGISDRTVVYPTPSAVAPGAPMPVTLLRFSATWQEGGVTLRWATATEQNSQDFFVEKSLDGYSWQVLGGVAAAGNSAQVRAYEFLDPGQPMTRSSYYYRLRQVDRDGRTAYSPVQTATLPAETAPVSIAAYLGQPGYLQFAGLAQPMRWQAQLSTALGRPVLNAPLSAAGLPLPVLPAGVYLVRLFNPTTGASVVLRYAQP